MSTTKKPVDNGVNVNALLEARKALTDAPEGAQFTWRATCEWKRGTHSRSTVEGFYGLGGEQRHRTAFTFDADHPHHYENQGEEPTRYLSVSDAGQRRS